jgi:hypothetical protein
VINSKSTNDDGPPNCPSRCRVPPGPMGRFIGPGAGPVQSKSPWGLSNEGKGSEEYVQIRAIVQLATVNLNFI